ncbi:MAG: hypothetical protein PUG98_05320 [Clostridium sp.]|nr:hypothetical protein [Clostridium sp.]
MDAFSEGTNHLIQMGAMCVTRPQDILLDLWGEENLYTEENEDRQCISHFEKQKNNLAPAEKIVYSLLGLDPVHVDDIITQAKLGVSSTISVLYELEQKKLIKQPVRGYYIWNL